MDRRKQPGERNTRRKCACGCGATITRYDGQNRPRMYVSGHNRFAGIAETPTQDAVLRAVRRGLTSPAAIARSTKLGINAVTTALSRLKVAQLVDNVPRGSWRPVTAARSRLRTST